MWESKIWSRDPRDSDPRKTALARISSIYKRQTRPLVREGVPRKQDRNCQRVINIWGSTPTLTDWLTVSRSVTLTLADFSFLSDSDRLQLSSRAMGQEMARGLHSFEVLIPVLRSVARRRLVKTGNPSACATVKRKVCKSAIALYCLYLSVIIKRDCNQCANKSNHPNYYPSFLSRVPPYTWQ
jgi:hypothetical protein